MIEIKTVFGRQVKVFSERPKTINEMLESTVSKYPDKEAVIDGDVRLSYRELQKRIDVAAANLKKSFRIKKGDRIAIMNQGHLIQYDEVSAILQNPKNEFVENLLGNDRNLKALTLEKTKDFLEKDNFLTVSPEENQELVKKKMMDQRKKFSFIVDENGLLVGRYTLESSRTGKNELKCDHEPVVMDRNTNLIEALSKMLETGERHLPVVNSKGKLVGLINLINIFAHVEAEEKKANV